MQDRESINAFQESTQQKNQGQEATIGEGLEAIVDDDLVEVEVPNSKEKPPTTKIEVFVIGVESFPIEKEIN